MPPTQSKARRAARGSWVEGLGRYGLVSKGILYGIVAALALRVALGYGGKPEDRGGAMRAIGKEPLGKAMLLALAVGLAGYAVWRLAEAFYDRGDEGDGAKGIAKRLGSLARAGWYGGLCGLTLSALVGESGGGNEKKTTAGVFERPLGRELVAAVGLAVLAAGLYNAFRAVTGKYDKDMRLRKMSDGEEKAFHVVGIFGHLARGLVFTLIGVFVVRAAWQFDAKEAIGLDGALQKLANQELGPLWLGIVATGLGAYAIFCFAQARYRDV